MTYCKAPYINTYINSNGKLYPCCAWQQVHEYDQTTVQAQMQSGEIPLGCSRCAAQDSAGIDSVRQNWNSEPSVPHAEIAVDNTCNLECVMCSSMFSHRIHRREIAIYGKPVQPNLLNNNTAWQNINWKQIQHLRLYGGEPTVSTGTTKLLSHLINTGDIEHIHLVIPTNCAEPPNTVMQTALSKADSSTIDLSIDAWGELNSWQRSGTDWNTTHTVLNTWRRHRDELGCTLTVNCTLTPYNIVATDTLIQQINDMHVHIEPVFYPEPFDVRRMPKKLKNTITVNNHYVNNILADDQTETNWQFPQHHQKIVQYYKQDPRHLYPHLIPYLPE